MRRLNHPVYRNRLLQVAADAVLVALAFFLAFRCASSTTRTGCRTATRSSSPSRSASSSLGKLIVFAAFGLYQKWWRYVSGRDFLHDRPRRRRRQRDPGRRSSPSLKPFDARRCRARSR